jgi:DNA-binding Lrp family transcriptional regulator
MDRFDQRILAALRRNARQSVSAIAEQVNLSRSAVSERIKRMEEQGEIRGYQVLTAEETQNPNLVKAYFEILQQGYKCEEISPLLLKYPEVKYCHGISGKVDLLVYLEVENMQRLHDIRHELDLDLPPNIKITTHIIMREWRSD